MAKRAGRLTRRAKIERGREALPESLEEKETSELETLKIVTELEPRLQTLQKTLEKLNLGLQLQDIDSDDFQIPSAYSESRIDTIYEYIFTHIKPEVVERIYTELSQFISNTLIPQMTEQYDIQITPVAVVQNTHPDAISYHLDTHNIQFGIRMAIATLREKQPYQMAALRHELAHAISQQQNEETIPNIENFQRRHEVGAGYGKGNILDQTSLFQFEGFANFCADYDSPKDIYTHNRLLAEIHGFSQEKQNYTLARIFNNPYEFGTIVYNMVYEAWGMGTVKKIAFEQPLNRDQLLDIYTQACVQLGIEPIEFPQIPTHVEQAIQLGVNKEFQTEQLNNLAKRLDAAIDAVVQKGVEPVIYFSGHAEPGIAEALEMLKWDYSINSLMWSFSWSPKKPSPYAEEYPDEFNFHRGSRIDAEIYIEMHPEVNIVVVGPVDKNIQKYINRPSDDMQIIFTE